MYECQTQSREARKDELRRRIRAMQNHRAGQGMIGKKKIHTNPGATAAEDGQTAGSLVSKNMINKFIRQNPTKTNPASLGLLRKQIANGRISTEEELAAFFMNHNQVRNPGSPRSWSPNSGSPNSGSSPNSTSRKKIQSPLLYSKI